MGGWAEKPGKEGWSHPPTTLSRKMSEDAQMSFNMFTTLASIAKQIMHYLRVEESLLSACH